VTQSRRTFLKTAAAATVATALPPRAVRFAARRTLGRVPPGEGPLIDDPALEAIAHRAVDAAVQAGASYADVRLTRTRAWRVDTTDPLSLWDSELLHLGARALVDGYWGFAATPAWTVDAAARVGREAVAQAKANALGKQRVVSLGTIPVVDHGRWTMPVRVDPFALPVAELGDRLGGIEHAIARVPQVAGLQARYEFLAQDKAFASSAGSYLTQRRYLTGADWQLTVRLSTGAVSEPYTVARLAPAGRGLEHIVDAPLEDDARAIVEEAERDARLPAKPVEVGRYATAFDAATMIALLDQTLGPATELDRALGYEANAGGTSYITDPLAMVGSYQAAAPAVTVMADRSAPGGCATTKWDDEGVEPDAFPIVKDGTLVDFQTTRESAAWLAGYYATRGAPTQSHGCAVAATAEDPVLAQTPNLSLAPGAGDASFDDLVREVRDGIAVRRAALMMDFRASSGMGLGTMYQIKGGKPVARIGGAAFLFRSTELWKSVIALGGAASAEARGRLQAKGEPVQRSYHTVRAVPAIVKDLTVVDWTRRA
jgi:TldD protein